MILPEPVPRVPSGGDELLGVPMASSVKTSKFSLACFLGGWLPVRLAVPPEVRATAAADSPFAAAAGTPASLGAGAPTVVSASSEGGGTPLRDGVLIFCVLDDASALDERSIASMLIGSVTSLLGVPSSANVCLICSDCSAVKSAAFFDRNMYHLRSSPGWFCRSDFERVVPRL